MATNIILKNYKNTGTTMETFKEEIKKFVDHTAWVKMYPTNIRFLSFKTKNDILLENKKDIKRVYTFYLLDKESMEMQVKKNKGFPEVPVTTTLVGGKPNSNSLFLDQIIEDTGIMVELMDKDGKPYYYGLSEYALPTLAAKAGLKGDRVRENSLFRDLYIANGIINPNVSSFKTREEERRANKILSGGLTFALRKVKPQKGKEKNSPVGLGVILSTFSGNYKDRDANVFLDVIKSLEKNKEYGKATVDNWSNTQDYLTITLNFDKLTNSLKKEHKIDKDLKVQIQIQNSDCGLSSLTVQGLVVIGKHEAAIGAGVVKEKNGMKLDMKSLMKKINQEITEEIKKIVKDIGALQKQTLPEEDKEKHIGKITDKAIYSMPSIKKTLGLERIDILKRTISNNVKPQTVLDVVEEILSFPTNIDKMEHIEPLGRTAHGVWLKENKIPTSYNYKEEARR